MDSDDKVHPKVVGSNTSSSAVSSPVDKGVGTANHSEVLQDFLMSFSKKELGRSGFDGDWKQPGMLKCKSSDQKVVVGLKGCKLSDSKKAVTSDISHVSRKQSRKGDHPVQFPPSGEESQDSLSAKALVCKNLACRAVMATEDTFCKRCSCCICHMFDDNKDPSLWLVCMSEQEHRDSCGLSCHLECALQHQKAGVINLGEFLQLDGSYCCASCGKISSIIECWKKQLVIAKDARRVDVLCYRISLSFRILDGTSRFKELHEIVVDAKAKLETEVGEVNGVSAKMVRGIVSRLSVASDVHKLCDLAIKKVDEWLSSVAASNPTNREDSLPAACKFHFVDVTSSSLVIVLKETRSTPESIKGYKLWYSKSREKSQEKEPIVFPSSRRRILITNLHPCTEYTFRIISFTEKGDFGHSVSNCFTKSVEIISKRSEIFEAKKGSLNCKRKPKAHAPCSSGFKVRDLGRILRRAWAEEHGDLDGFCSDGMEEESCGGIGVVKPEVTEGDQPRSMVSRELDLNVMSVPDLNAEIVPPPECSPDDVTGCTSEKLKRPARSNGSDTQTWADGCPTGEVAAVESRSKLCRRKAVSVNEDGDSTLVSGSPLRFSNSSAGKLDDHYEYCVKVIRWLECRGHIEKDFRMKFLTWFSLRSTEQERRVVHTFIDTLVDDPSSLAGQLVDSFLDIIMCKRPRNSFCSKLWH